jgi:hypothetical protein
VLIAPSTIDAVQHVGGWMFDRATEGWDIYCLISEHADHTPLRILGARSIVGLDQALATTTRGTRPSVIAVSAALYQADNRLRHELSRALKQGASEIRLWPGQLGSSPCGDPTPYTPSKAALAFKTHALTSAGLLSDTSGAEAFHEQMSLNPRSRPRRWHTSFRR